MLRVASGIYRSRVIYSNSASTAHPELRPTTNFHRQVLTNWLAPYLHDAVVLDLFAGTGSLGIEALSRGAAEVTFVEKRREFCDTLQKTLASFSVPTSQYEIFCGDASAYCRQATKNFTIVFADPPYASFHLADDALAEIHSAGSCANNAHLGIEMSRAQFQETQSLPFAEMLKSKTSKNRAISLWGITPTQRITENDSWAKIPK